MHPQRMRDCDGLIIAGGRGRRLKLGPKWQVAVGGRTMLEHVIDLVQPQLDRLWLNLPAGAHPVSSQQCISDGKYHEQGPLAGLLAGLEHSRTPFLYYHAVDAIRTPPDLAQRLRARLGPKDTGCYVSGHHSCGLIRSDNLPALQQYLQSGHRSVIAWLRCIGAIALDCEADDPQWIWSINTPPERAAAEQRIGI